VLVEASSPTFASLGTAENTAATEGVVSIGNSYAGGESSADIGYNTSYYGHPGIAITAATGDSGYAGGRGYPAASPDVIAVGGTTLTAVSNTRGYTETAWSSAGSGCSAYESQPPWQSLKGLDGSITSVCAKRALADVSAVADPNTGVAVYDTYGLSGWTVFGGTSVSTQIISAIYGLNGGLGTYNNGGAASGLYYAYTEAPGDFFSITSGSNGSCGTDLDLCNAWSGWNGPTGLGTPDGAGAF
jgi:subtilase family serine protease